MKILILEDNPADIEFIRRELKKAGKNFVVSITDTREEFVRAVKEFDPEVIISDHSLPQFNSLEALNIAKEQVPWAAFL
ncbi:MAG TPA: response regulator, partial [Bacteroidia bacterium]|nr:response regulator [Bacteroidia bacterium]